MKKFKLSKDFLISGGSIFLTGLLFILDKKKEAKALEEMKEDIISEVTEKLNKQ